MLLESENIGPLFGREGLYSSQNLVIRFRASENIIMRQILMLKSFKATASQMITHDPVWIVFLEFDVNQLYLF